MHRNLWRVATVKISDKAEQADQELYNWQGLHPDREIMFANVNYVPADHGFFWLHIFYREIPEEVRRLRESFVTDSTGPARPAEEVSTGNTDGNTDTKEPAATEETTAKEPPAEPRSATLSAAAAAALKTSN